MGSLAWDMTNRNILSRMQNSLAAAINKEVLLPKAIIIVLEDDLLKIANHFKAGADKILEPWIQWITKEFHRSIVAYKEKLPSKARKFKYPTILWVPAMIHEALDTTNYYKERHN